MIMFLAISLPLQSMLAVDVPLKKNDPGTGGIPGINMMSMSLRSTTSINPVVVSIIDTNLVVDFDNSIGIVRVNIVDQNGMVVYQDAINTNSSLESVIETSGWDSGNYTIHISYGKTSLVGTFQL
jgi:flagellar hook assembly protein FlgD